MKENKRFFIDGIYMVLVLVAAYVVNFFIQEYFSTQALIPMIFVLGVFLISLKTQGYLWGISASLISVIAVNFAFTFPYYAFDFLMPESLSSAIVMLIVATMTSTLTTKIKKQERMWVENEKEKMRANLLRAISHDLRTPLTSIYGSTSAIIENYDSLKKEQQIKLLKEVNEDAEWLIHMVENLLSVTRIDGEKVQVVKTPAVLEELIDDTLLKFHKRYPNQSIKVTIPDEFISIPIDALLIQQVIINILENAVFHAKDMTELALTVKQKEKQLIFEIADNGVGIPKEKLEDLFTGYLDRTHTVTDGSRNNMGIGLSVCATIIRAHGGEISAENKVDGGGVFRFSLEMEE